MVLTANTTKAMVQELYDVEQILKTVRADIIKNVDSTLECSDKSYLSLSVVEAIDSCLLKTRTIISALEAENCVSNINAATILNVTSTIIRVIEIFKS